MKPKPQIQKMPEAGPNRSMLTIDGAPVLCALALRASTTAHGRVKAQVVAKVGDAPVLVDEFRLEMS